MDMSSDKVYFKKILDVYSIPVFTYLKEHRHPDIPFVQAFWEQDGKLVVIEELIQGHTLEEILPSLDFEEKKHVLLSVCDALTFLHSAEPPIIHRDVKASNIMLTDGGAVKLIDYDAAKLFTPGAKKDTSLIGTQGSAAPEQYGFAQSDERTDIYGLGKLVERLCPENETAAAIVRKATRLDPDKRYPSVERIQNAIRKMKETSGKERPEAYRAQDRKAGILVLAAVLVLTLASGISSWFKNVYYPNHQINEPAYESDIAASESRDNETDNETDYETEGQVREAFEALPAYEKGMPFKCYSALEVFTGKYTLDRFDGALFTDFLDYLQSLYVGVYGENNKTYADKFAACLKKAYGQDDFWENEKSLGYAEALYERGDRIEAYDIIQELSAQSSGSLEINASGISISEEEPAILATMESRRSITGISFSELAAARTEVCRWQMRADLTDYISQAEETFQKTGSRDTADSVIGIYKVLAEEDPKAQEKLTSYLDSVFDKANELRDKGSLTSAISLYERLEEEGYDGAEDGKMQAVYLDAKQKMANGQHEKAIEEFLTISGYQDADELKLECMYRYCKTKAEAPDDTAYRYMSTLLKCEYNGAEALSQRLYAWHADVTMTFSYKMGPQQGAAIDAALSGGPPDGSTHVRFEVTVEDTGEHFSYTPEETFSRGDTAGGCTG